MICYIILHYQVEEETINCVKQLKSLIGEHKIIIVDNCSPNGSGKRLFDMYANEQDVEVILHDKNDGFARGNNIGCKFAKDKYDPDFYVVMNNDIEITQNDFESLIYIIHNEIKFDVLGPDIYSTSSKIHQSPKSLYRTTIDYSELLLAKYRKKCKSKIVVPLRCYLKKISFLKKIKKQTDRKNSGIDSNLQYLDVPLHGSCVIFSKSFINCRKHAFFPGTFFYYEMEILDFECQLNNFVELYDPRLKVLHHQNVSTNSTYKNEIKRVRFMNEQNFKSIKSFLDAFKVDE